MQGSLDQPPIVVVASRRRAILLLAMSLAFVLVGGLILADGDPKGVAPGAMSAGFFGLCAVVALWMVVRPARLELGPSGIELRSMGRRRVIAWGQTANFRLARVSAYSKLIGFDYARANGRTSALAGLNDAIAGAQGALPSGWEIDDAKLIALLNEGRTRWVGASWAGGAPLPVGRTGDRLGRKPFWAAVALMTVLSLGIGLLPSAGRPAGIALAGIWIMIYARRLHDIGRSGWWQAALYAAQLIAVIALVVAHAGADLAIAAATLLQLAFTIWLGIAPGSEAENRFGAPPSRPVAQIVS